MKTDNKLPEAFSASTASNIQYYARWKSRATQSVINSQITLQYSTESPSHSSSALVKLESAVQKCFADAQVAYSTLRTFALETDPTAAAAILGVRLIVDREGNPSTATMKSLERTSQLNSYPAVAQRHHPTWPVPIGYISEEGTTVLDPGLSELRHVEALRVFEVCEAGVRQAYSIRQSGRRSELGK